MKKKIITLIICAVVLILPSIVAIISYSYAQNHPVARSAVSKMVLTDPDGQSYEFLKSDKTANMNMFDCFFNINDHAAELASFPSEYAATEFFTVTYTSYKKDTVCKYYFTQNPEEAFYVNQSGTPFRINASDAEVFLSSKYAICLFPSAAQPVMSVGSGAILPSDMEWMFLGFNGEYKNSDISVSDTTPVCDISGGLQLTFDADPDYLFVEIKNKSGATVFDDVYANMDPSLFSSNTVYDVTVTAKWYKTEERTNYGEGIYKFTANVLSPAVFYLSNSEIAKGEFVIISAKNIVDVSQINFKAEPEINYTPVFFKYGEYYHALVPISMKLKDEDQYAFTVAYGGVSQEMTLKITPRKIITVSQDISLADINKYRSDAALREFDSLMSGLFSQKCETVYWMEDNMLIQPVKDRLIKTGFGINIKLTAANITYSHEGVNFIVKNNDNVLACLPGKVIYVGEPTLSGKTIVIEHGGGLKSLYAHMSSTVVKVGDEVTKGQSIGVVGSTGFCTGRTLHFGLYVFGVPVRYYPYEESGVRVADAVANELGLISGNE